MCQHEQKGVFENMKILIIGAGKLGFAVADRLSQDNHDITIIDNREHAVARAAEKIDVLCMKGSALNKQTLLEANVTEADFVIITTGSDETNIVCAMLVNVLKDTKIVVRLRDPEYLETGDFIREVGGINLMINPELSTANEVSRLLRYPYAHSMESFARGKMEMVEFLLDEDSPVIGEALYEIMPRAKANVLICLVNRHGEVFTANGSTVLEKGDHIFVVGTPKQVFLFAKYLKVAKQKIRTAMIVGGGKIGYYLARQISAAGMNTRIIESDLERCNYLQRQLKDVIVLHGDGTDQELLEQEQIKIMDAFVALTNRDEENILAGLFAQEAEVPKVITKVKRPFYYRMTESMSTVNPKELATEKIAHFVQSVADSEGRSFDMIYRIANGKAKVIEFNVGSNKEIVNVPLRELKLKDGILVAAILHNDEIIMPDGNVKISAGDKVLVVTCRPSQSFDDISDLLV